MKKRGASTTTVIGSLIVGLLIGAGVLYAASPSIGLGGSTVTQTVAGGTVTSTVQAAGGLCSGQTVTIGALNDLSGALSSQGKGDLAAEQLGIQDVNAYAAAAGCKVTFALNNNDYKLDTPTALTQLQAMQAAGIQIVIGPLNSGTAAGILSFANSNHIVLLSPSSTSPALAIPNDYLFRTAPNDAAQGQADARILLDRGASAVIIINRDDTYGNGLANATKTFLQKDNPSVVIKGPYKYDTATSDFSSLITQIGSDWTTLSGQVGASKVAIFAVSFQELGTLLLQAQKSNPALLSTPLPWFGTDGDAQNTVLSNSTTGPVVSQVKLPSTLFNVVNNSRTNDFFARIKGTPAYAAIASNVFYSLEGYDDVWLAALAILSAGANSGTAIHNVLPSVAANFFGLTGWEGLQSSGDRIPGSYQVWKVVKNGAAFSWVLAGTWDYSTDSVTWNSPP
ncbi:MAG: ABC transporter substrate-binding protein [Nitrososphaerales archaeon]|nr:ABC transporter substrate-binding protein [Nitrososphaerales archaeon]